MESSGYVCYECGVKYLTEAQKKEDRVSTYHHGTCCLCREIKGVTHIRNFNHLNKV